MEVEFEDDEERAKALKREKKKSEKQQNPFASFNQVESIPDELQTQQSRRGPGRPKKKQEGLGKQMVLGGAKSQPRSDPVDAEGFKVPFSKKPQEEGKDEDLRRPSELVQKLRTEGNRQINLDNLPQRERECKEMLEKVQRQMRKLEMDFFKEEESEDEDTTKEELAAIVKRQSDISYMK